VERGRWERRLALLFVGVVAAVVGRRVKRPQGARGECGTADDQSRRAETDGSRAESTNGEGGMTVSVEALRQGTAEIITRVERTISARRDWYRRRAKWNAIFFRATGVAVIAIASALPVLASFSYRGKDEIVATAGALVAFLTALRSFYQWDQLWSVLRQSDFDISYLLERWKVDLSAAAELPEAERFARVQVLGAALLEQTEAVRKSESQRYFGTLHFPESSQAGAKTK
jgi:ABC-type multidrug transport system fused ATPase/permease subunit